MKCDYKNCDKKSVTVCAVQDLEGDEYIRVLCKMHMKKLIN